MEDVAQVIEAGIADRDEYVAGMDADLLRVQLRIGEDAELLQGLDLSLALAMRVALAVGEDDEENAAEDAPLGIALGVVGEVAGRVAGAPAPRFCGNRIASKSSPVPSIPSGPLNTASRPPRVIARSYARSAW